MADEEGKSNLGILGIKLKSDLSFDLRFAHHWNQHTKEEDYQQFYQTDNFLYKCAFMFLLF